MGNTIIIGCGTYGQVYYQYLKDSNKYNIIGFVDDDPSKHGQKICGLDVLGDTKLLFNKDIDSVDTVFAPLGNNKKRFHLLKKLGEIGYNTPSYIHLDTNLHHTTRLGVAVYILPRTNIMPYSTISDYVMISMGVNIAHHTVVKNGCFISQGANIGASVSLEENSFIGIAATVMTGVSKIGENALVGAGAVVTKDIDANSVVVGNPARTIRKR